MNRFNVPRHWLLGTLIIFSVSPVIAGYVTSLLIDIFYNAAILLLMNELTWYIFRTDIYKKDLKHPVLTDIAKRFLCCCSPDSLCCMPGDISHPAQKTNHTLGNPVSCIADCTFMYRKGKYLFLI